MLNFNILGLRCYVGTQNVNSANTLEIDCSTTFDRCVTDIHIDSGTIEFIEFSCGAIAEIDTNLYADNTCTPDISAKIQKCICSQPGCNTPFSDNGMS